MISRVLYSCQAVASTGDSKASVNFDLNAMFSTLRREHDELKERHTALQEDLKTTQQQLAEQCKIAGNLQEENETLMTRLMSLHQAQAKAKVSRFLFLPHYCSQHILILKTIGNRKGDCA